MTAWSKGEERLTNDPTWGKLSPEQKRSIREECGLLMVSKPAVDTPHAIADALSQRGLAERGDIGQSRIERLKPGAKLIREWRGEIHQVVVLDNGFEWRGRHWRSLSMIAREITQSHWSGPRFFGLKGKKTAAFDLAGPGHE